MGKFLNYIVESTAQPVKTNVLWIKNGIPFYYNKKWKPLFGAGSGGGNYVPLIEGEGANSIVLDYSNNIASNINSIALGYNTTSLNFAETAFGQYNISTKSDSLKNATLFSIGNGTEKEKSNAFEVKYNGDVYVKGIDVSIQNYFKTLADGDYSIISKIENVEDYLNAGINDLNDKVITNTSAITQTAEQITSEVSRVEEYFNGKISETNSTITQTADSILLEVENNYTTLKGDIQRTESKIEQTSESIALEVESVQKKLQNQINTNKTSILQSSREIDLLARSTETINQKTIQNEANIAINANSINSKVSQEVFNSYGNSVAEQFTEVNQTIEGIDTTVQSVTGEITTIRQDINGLTVKSNALEADVESLKKQSDGAIDTHFGTEIPTLNNIPAVNWTTSEEKNDHVGDLYYNNISGEAFRFSYNPDDNSYFWIMLSDSALTDALNNIAALQEAVDGKVTIFYTEPKNYKYGDVWFVHRDYTYYKEGSIVTSTNIGQDVIKESFSEADWVDKTKYASTKEVETELTNLNTYIEGSFKDGVLTETEIQQIKEFKKSFELKQSELKESYTILYLSSVALDKDKTALKAAFENLESYYTNLIAAIDGLTINTIEAYNTAYKQYLTSLKNYSKVQSEFTNSIQSELSKANDYIADISADNIITPIEKKQLIEIWRSISEEFATNKNIAVNYKIIDSSGNKRTDIYDTDTYYTTYIAYKNSYDAVSVLFSGNTFGLNDVTVSTTLSSGNTITKANEKLEAYYYNLKNFSSLISKITIDITDKHEEAIKIANELQDQLSPTDEITTIGKGVVLSSVIGVQSEGILEAVLNASDNVSEASNDKHGKIVFASGIAGSDDWNTASTVIYEDGHIKMNSGEIGDRVSIGNAIIGSFVEGESSLNIVNIINKKGEKIPLFTVDVDEEDNVLAVGTPYNLYTNRNFIARGYAAGTTATTDGGGGGIINKESIISALQYTPVNPADLGALAYLDGLSYSDVGVTKDVVTSLIGPATYAPYNASGYLPLSGGTLRLQQFSHFRIDSQDAEISRSAIVFSINNVFGAQIGWDKYDNRGTYLYNYSSNSYLGIKNDDGTPYWNNHTLLHSGNVGDFALPIIEGVPHVIFGGWPNIEYYNGPNLWGRIGFSSKGVAAIHNTSQWRAILHEGNIGDYALKTNGSNKMGASAYINWATAEGEEDYSAYNDGIRLLGYNPTTGNYMGGIHIGTRYGWQIVRDGYTGAVRVRYHEMTTSSWSAWKNIAFTSDLDNYLPLSGGTMNENATIHWGANNTEDYTAFQSGFRLLQYNTAASQYRGGIHVGTYYGWQMTRTNQVNVLQFRGYDRDNAQWSSWKTIAFTDSTVAAANRLVTSAGVDAVTVNESAVASFASYIQLNNNKSLSTKDTDGVARQVLYMNIHNSLVLGSEVHGLGDSIFGGTNVYLRYGNSPTVGVILNSSGNVTIGGSDLAGTSAKLYVGGATRIISNVIIGSSSLENGRLKIVGADTSSLTPALYVMSASGIPILDVRNGGNVLIGSTTDDGAKLQVNGGISIASGYTLKIGDATISYVNGVLKVDKPFMAKGYAAGATASVSSGEGGGVILNKDSVIEALGYTPYDSANPNGYITTSALSGYQLSSGLGSLAYKSSLVASDIPDLSSKYLPISGGTINGSDSAPLIINTSANTTSIVLRQGGANKTQLAWDSSFGSYIYNYASSKFIGIKNDGTPHYNGNTLYHTGNFNPADYLPLKGGTINGDLSVRNFQYVNSDGTVLSRLVPDGNNPSRLYHAVGAEWNIILHSGNVGDYALKIDGSNEMLNNLPLGKYSIIYNASHDASWTNPQNSGLRILNAIQAKPTEGVTSYAVGLSVSGYYGFQLASDGGNYALYYRGTSTGANTGDWKTIAFTDSDIIGKSGGIIGQHSTTSAVPSMSTGELSYIYNIHKGINGIFDSNSNANSLLTVSRHSGGYLSQLGFSGNGNLYYRSVNAGEDLVSSSWKTIAFTDSTVAAANKLVTSAGADALLVDNNKHIYTSGYLYSDRSGAPVSVLDYMSDGSLLLGYGIAVAGLETQIHGKTIKLRGGTSRTIGFVLNESGNVTIGGSDLAGTTHKLYVDGWITTKYGYRTYDSGDYGIWNGGQYSSSLTSTDIAYHATKHVFYIGKVLIGTMTDNGAKLQVGGNFTCSQETRSNIFFFTTNGEDKGWFGSPNNLDASDFVASVYDGNIRFYANNSERMRIANNGNVGIGTTAPQYKLDVAGNVGITSANGLIDIANGQIKGNATLTIGVIGTFCARIQTSHYSTGYTCPLIINPNGGNVLIGAVSDNGARLQVNGNISTTTSIKIGDATLTWDDTNKVLKCDKPIMTTGYIAGATATAN